jgi:aminoglycoside phosphotransferase (APT) family kinase protein
MPRATRITARLRAGLASEGFLVRRAVRLSRAGEAPSCRLDLRDGQFVKLRLFRTAAAARKVWRLLGSAGDSILARPLFLLDRALVTEYVEGEPLDKYLRRASRGAEVSVVRATGRMMAQLHRQPVVRGTALGPAGHHRYLTRALRRLARRGLLNRESAARLARLRTPMTVQYALTHGDICPENVILASSGIRFVDEERLAVRVVAFDLARAVTRWPLEPGLEAQFLAAYRREGGDDSGFREDRPFWVATALAGSATYRLRRRLPGVRRILAELRALAAIER